MTLSEFKAWFEGFTERMDAAPDEKQWERIKARVKDINGSPVTQNVFVDLYGAPYRHLWMNPNQAYQTYGMVNHGDGLMSQSTPGNPAFNSCVAMLDLGKAEYKSAMEN